jgi:hypothetical protein
MEGGGGGGVGHDADITAVNGNKKVTKQNKAELI